MPEVVSQVEALEKAASSSNGSGSNGSRPPRIKSWAASPKLFPCEVSPEARGLMKEVGHQEPGSLQARLMCTSRTTFIINKISACSLACFWLRPALNKSIHAEQGELK